MYILLTLGNEEGEETTYQTLKLLDADPHASNGRLDGFRASSISHVELRMQLHPFLIACSGVFFPNTLHKLVIRVCSFFVPLSKID